jgi:hypothetical protein
MALSFLLRRIGMELNAAFALALKDLRMRRKLAHHSFFGGTSRAYMTLLEKGTRCPTIAKIEDLSTVLDIHPVSLLVECYLQKNPDEDLKCILERVKKDLAFDLSSSHTDK